MRAAVLLLACVLLAPALQAAGVEDIRVTPLVREGELLVSFSAPGAVTDELRDAIRSGLVVTFTYGVELRQRAFLWFDRTLAESEMAASVRYDNLSRTYHVSRMTDGRVTWSQTSASEDEIRSWLTGFDRLKLFGGAALEVNTDYQVHVRARVSPRRAWLLWPWGRHDATGRATFTYLR
jgi:hypothetical protein